MDRKNVPNCAKLMTNLCPLRKLMFNGFSRLKSTFSSFRKFLHLLSLLSYQARGSNGDSGDLSPFTF